MTPQDIITQVRHITSDTVLDYRNGDTELLAYVNDGLKETSRLRPDLFTKFGDMVCDPSALEQGVTFAGAQALVEVTRVVGGAMLTPFDLAVLSAFNPAWPTETAGTPTQWSRHPQDPLRFYLYPPPAAGHSVTVRYVALPTVVGLADTITEIPESLLPALVDYTVFRAESKDDEHSNSGRAAAHYQTFLNALGVGAK